MKSNKIFPEENPDIIALYKVIKKFGPITQRDYLTFLKRLELGIWNIKDLLSWAEVFYNDPWRRDHKEYRSVGYFLRDPERYMEKAQQKDRKEEAWKL